MDLEGRSKSTPCRGNRGGILGPPTQDPIDGDSTAARRKSTTWSFRCPVPCFAAVLTSGRLPGSQQSKICRDFKTIGRVSTSPTIFTTRDLRWSCYGRSSTAQPTPAINGAPCIPHWTWALPVDRGTTWQFALSQQPQGPPRWFRRLCAHVEVPTEPKTGHKGCHGLR